MPVSLDEMVYHTPAWRAARNALIIADMPFGSIQESAGAARACGSADAGGAQMVKLRGVGDRARRCDSWLLATFRCARTSA